MSHSLIAKRSRTSVSLSETAAMALASDSLFEKFGLFEQEDQQVIEAEPVTSSATTGNMVDNLSFEDLDFADLLEIKDEPLSHLDSGSSDNNTMNIEDFDPFFPNMESLVDDASLDSIKSDCMWSSVNLFNGVGMDNRKRRRDVSLTLSECAEGLLSIDQLDVNMLDQLTDAVSSAQALGSSPNFANFANLDNSNPSSNDNTEEDDDTEDEDVDVVGTDLGGSSARTRHCFLSSNRRDSKPKPIEAGRSLLKKQLPIQRESSTSNVANNKTILDDHCYFLARPQKNDCIKPPLKGMLTPNESSEDEDVNDTSSVFNTGTPTIVTNNVDKRKIAEAVQSLIKNRPDTSVSNNIKFKFRMKFKSTKAANSMKKAASAIHHQAVDQAELNRRERRKSASRNAYCPPPSKNNSPLKIRHQHKQQQQSLLTANSHKKMAAMAAAAAAAAVETNSSGSDSDKCREIRDLHNSMERQRRVEQRNHLAYLKKQVPEVADVEKASKLTILRKAMDYCHLLSNMDSRIRKDKDKENSRNQMLKKKLMELTQKHDARRQTTSGRLTGWSHGRY